MNTFFKCFNLYWKNGKYFRCIMKILLDIGHPAHVHYFKYSIEKLKNSGNTVIVVAREKEITFDLLKAYKIPFISRGKGKQTLTGKFFYLFYGTYKIFNIALKYKIDCYLSFASPYNALASVFYRKPNITFDDTEHNVFNHRIYKTFSDAIFTPEYFKKSFGKKHFRFKGTMDSAYLHPAYFRAKEVEFPERTDKLSGQKKVILRLVSWNASHDINQHGFSSGDILKLIEVLSKYADVYVSTEKQLPGSLDKYLLKVKPEDIHYYMLKADLFIGESGSMATEAPYLGTHSIVLNSASNELGVFDWFSVFKTFHIADDFNDVITTSIRLLERDDLKSESKAESELIINNSVCLTDFIYWLIINYPGSISKLIDDNGKWFVHWIQPDNNSG